MQDLNLRPSGYEAERLLRADREDGAACKTRTYDPRITKTAVLKKPPEKTTTFQPLTPLHTIRVFSLCGSFGVRLRSALATCGNSPPAFKPHDRLPCTLRAWLRHHRVATLKGRDGRGLHPQGG